MSLGRLASPYSSYVAPWGGRGFLTPIRIGDGIMQLEIDGRVVATATEGPGRSTFTGYGAGTATPKLPGSMQAPSDPDLLSQGTLMGELAGRRRRDGVGAVAHARFRGRQASSLACLPRGRPRPRPSTAAFRGGAPLTAAVAVIVVAAATGGCATGTPDGERVVFAVQRGVKVSGPIHRDEILSVGVPPLQNVSSQPVRIRSVQWVDQPAVTHVLNIYAYNARQTHGWVNSLEGDLPVSCPKQYRPRLPRLLTIPAHTSSDWYIVIAFTISKLGRYYLNRVKITYTADGHEGWQYQNLNQEFTVVNPPMPGPVPIPRSGICG